MILKLNLSLSLMLISISISNPKICLDGCDSLLLEDKAKVRTTDYDGYAMNLLATKQNLNYKIQSIT